MRENPGITFSVKSTFKYIFRLCFSTEKLKRTVFIFFISFTGITEAQIQFDLNSNFRYLKGSEAATIAADWMKDTFDASGWTSGGAPFRYGDGAGGTQLADMQNNYSTLYLRSTFDAFSIDRIKNISFSVNYDDGFVIWINGVKVFSRNAPASLTASSLAIVNHESGILETFVLDSAEIHLVEGETCYVSRD